MSVQILNAAIEEDEEFGTIIRGVIDQETFKFIKLDWYQREQGFSAKHTNEIVSAYFANNAVEDLTLGMRGTRIVPKGGTYLLVDKVYCINGGQRLWAAQWALKEHPNLKLHLGTKVILNTTEKIENEIFCKAGTTQVRIAASVLVRNKKKESEVANLLLQMNNDPNFALKDRIAWDQRKTAHELMTGFTFCRVVGALHAHKSAALKNSKPYELLIGLDRLYEVVGEENIRLNMIKFFNAIDSCWSIRQLTGRRDPAPHMKQFFLLTLARLCSRYPEFWDGKERSEFNFLPKYIKLLKGFQLSKFLTRSDVVDTEILFENLRKQLKLQPIFDGDIADAAE